MKFIELSNGRFKYYSNRMADNAIVKKSLMILMDGHEHSPKFVDNGGKWDGYIRFGNSRTRTFESGFLTQVKKAIKKAGIDCNVKYVKKFKTSISWSKTIEERDYQKEGCEAFFKRKHGTLIIPTRGGKTYTAAECIKHITGSLDGCNVLFVVDTQDLLVQARKDISQHLGINADRVGKIQGKVFLPKQVTVVTIQTIQSIIDWRKRLENSKHYKALNRIEKSEKRTIGRNRYKLLKEYLNSLSMFVIDECHEYSSPFRISFIQGLINICEFRLFISATPFKSEGELDNWNLRKVCGEVLCEIKEKRLEEDGYLAKDKVILVDINHKDNKNIDIIDFQDGVKQVITHNVERNFILLSFVQILREMNVKTLVLFSRKKHGYFIKSITGDPFVSGDIIKTGDREFLKNKFLKRKGGVLFASDVWKKGITLPEVQVLINASGGLEQNTIIQRRGRVKGSTKLKSKAMIIDFIDEHENFSGHSKSRIKAYMKLTKIKNINVLDSKSNDLYDDFRELVKSWFGDELV